MSVEGISDPNVFEYTTVVLVQIRRRVRSVEQSQDSRCKY